MVTIAKDRLFTAEDLWDKEALEDAGRYELYDGMLIPMSPTGDKHGIVANWIGYLLTDFVIEHDLGEVTAAETGFRLAHNPDTVLAPDVAFIAKSRLTPLTGKYYEVAPDLAVEVVSPSDRAGRLHRKLRLYRKFRIPIVWVAYPDDRTIEVHKPDSAIKTLQGDDLLDGGDVLPGFTLPASEVFKRLRE